MSTPWEVSRQLTESRLRLIAAVFDRVRKVLVDLHEPDEGDGNWSFGCRAYERTCNQLSKLANRSENSKWLTVEFDKLSCTIRIEGVPIKFYRGAPEDPTPRALRGGASVALRDFKTGQTNLLHLLGEQWKDDGWFWLLSIDTHSDGSVSRITMLQATEAGNLRNVWEIPLEGNVSSLSLVTALQREAVDLPPPVVGPKAEETVAGESDPKVAGNDAAGTT